MLLPVPGQHLFFQQLNSKQLVETRVRGGRLEKSEVLTPSVYLAPSAQFTAKLARIFGRLLRLFAHALWLSPLLILPKALSNFVSPLVGDALLIAFVAIVVGFFLCLAGLVLKRLIGGAREELSGDVRPPDLALPDSSPHRALPAATRAAELKQLLGHKVRLRGILEGDEPADLPGLLHDLWLPGAGSAERVLSSATWSVASGDVTVTADLDAAPRLRAPTREVPAQEWFEKLGAACFLPLQASERWSAREADARLATLHSGDAVEITGTVARIYDEAESETESVGYRRSGARVRPVVVLEASLSTPLTLHKLPDFRHK